jgi:hypothetical protein
MRRTLVSRFDSFVLRFAHGVLAALLVVATAGSAGAGVEIGLNFTGHVWSPPTAPDRSVATPDTMGAVGEQHIVELLNDGYAVYRKSDGLLERSSTLTEFWVAAGVTSVVGQAFDPRVLYDAASGRWFAVSIDGWTDSDPNRLIEPNSYLVAVSKSADPTEGWTGFQIDSDPDDTSWVDFPQIGMDAVGLYVGAIRDKLGPAGNTPELGQSLLVFPKADLLAATPSIANVTNWPLLYFSEVGFLPQPVVNYDGRAFRRRFSRGTTPPWAFSSRPRSAARSNRPFSLRRSSSRSPTPEGAPWTPTSPRSPDPRRISTPATEGSASTRCRSTARSGLPRRRGWTAAWACVGTRSMRRPTACSSSGT